MYYLKLIVCNEYGSFCVGSSIRSTSSIATPPIDRALLAAYGEAAHGADIRFTIKEDGSVGDVEVVSSSGSSALDAAIVDTISKWRFSPLQIPMVNL